MRRMRRSSEVDRRGRWPRLINPHQESKGRRDGERERHLEIVGGKWPSERASK